MLFSRVRVVRGIASGNGELRRIWLLSARLTSALWGKSDWEDMDYLFESSVSIGERIPPDVSPNAPRTNQQYQKRDGSLKCEGNPSSAVLKSQRRQN